MGNPNQSKIVHLVGSKRKNVNMGYSSTKRLGRAKPMSIMQEWK
jgi:hypothetical protein